MLEVVGGINGIGMSGSPSRRILMNEIVQFRPDKIIIMPCGFDLKIVLLESEMV